MNSKNELKALQEPATKTTKEWPEWVRKYKEAIWTDLNNAICENCGYIPALVYAPAKGATIYGKEYMGKEIFLCDECAKAISERLEEIESTIKEKYPNKRLFETVLRRVVFFYFILSGILVFGFLYNFISSFFQ